MVVVERFAKIVKGTVKKAKLYKSDIHHISRNLCYKGISPYSKNQDYNIGYSPVSCHFLPYILLLSVRSTISIMAVNFHWKKLWTVNAGSQ